MKNFGKFSPSNFSLAMTQGRGKENIGATARTLCRKIAMSRLGVIPRDISTWEMEWGNEWESIARERYEAETFQSVIKVHEPIQHTTIDYIEGTPDGLVADDGIIEIKCPANPENHFDNILEAKQLERYMWQGQGYLWITGRQWFDFVSFDPRYPEQLQISITRVERDEEKISLLAARIAELENIVQDYLKNIYGKNKI